MKIPKIPKNQLYKNCGRWKNFDCIFGFSVKSYVRNTINLSCAKILLTSVINYGIIIKSISTLMFTVWHFDKRKVYCVSNVTFHTESKYTIKIFSSPTVFVQWPFYLLIFRNFWYFNQWFFYTWTNILNGFKQRVVTYNLPLSYL